MQVITGHKLFGRTFGVQSLRCGGQLMVMSDFRCAEGRCRRCCCRACGVESWIVPYCLFFRRWLMTGVDLFLELAGQLFVALHGHWIGGGSQSQSLHFLMSVELKQLVKDAAHLIPVTLNTFGDL